MLRIIDTTWRTWELGDEVSYYWDDFDGEGSVVGKVTEKRNDYLIVEADGMRLRCDDYTSDMFRKRR